MFVMNEDGWIGMINLVSQTYFLFIEMTLEEARTI